MKIFTFCTYSAIPSKPKEVMGRMNNNTPYMMSGVGSVIPVNWLPPENQNETVIDYYELVMSGPDNDRKTFKVPARTTLPYYLDVGNVPVGKYIINVTAVDVCVQRSDPLQIVYNKTENIFSLHTALEKQYHLLVAIILLIIVTLLSVFRQDILALVRYVKRCNKEEILKKIK